MATTAPPRPRQRLTPPDGPRQGQRQHPSASQSRRAQSAALRRALLLVIGTVLVPGSAQRFAGNRRVGRIALGIWLAIIVVVALIALIGSRRPTMLVAIGSSDAILTALKAVLAVLGAGWLALLLDAWRLGRPPSLSRGGRLGLTGVTAVTFLLVAGLVSTGIHLLDVQRDLVGSVFAKSPAVGAVQGRYNVLVVGGDAGADREGLRPDSLTVVSVDAETGQTVLVGIPRNLMDAPFPEGTKLAELWPNGFDCGDECIINALYTWAKENAEDLPPSEDPGLEATRLAAEGVTGLSIPYTAIVDMAGFQQIVDALGGVTVDVGKRVSIGGGTGPIEGYIEPGVQKLDGYEALWFARSREGTSDYERMVRQKCLTSSLARQADPMTVLANYEQFARASAALVKTDIPTSDLPGLLGVARKVPTQPINAISLVPPLVDPVRPDYDDVHAMVQAMLHGEPAVAETADTGDGSVGNEGSSASAATQGSAPAATTEPEAPDGTAGTPTAQAGKAKTTGKGNAKGTQRGATAAELGLVCQPV